MQDLSSELSNSYYTWAVQLVRGIFIWVSFSSAGSGSTGFFCLFFEVFIAVDLDGVGDKLSGDIAILNTVIPQLTKIIRSGITFVS